MSRGGRRRRSKRGGARPGIPGTPRPQQGGQTEESDSPPASSRSRREGGGRNRTAVESMRTLPRNVQTLPPDGLILEDLIFNMQTEYGTPTTPQEYRLIVKVPTHEEPATVSPLDPAVPPEPDAEGGDEELVPRVPRSTRRRRRGRRRAGSVAGDEAALDEAEDSSDNDDDSESDEELPAAEPE